MIVPSTYVPKKNDLENKIIFITGATSGIGRALAIKLAQMGSKLIIHGRDAKKLESLHNKIGKIGYEPFIANLDLEKAQGGDYKNSIELIEKKFQKIDGLVHNAAILGDRSPIEHYDIGLWQKVIHINLTTVFILTRCLLPFLKNAQNSSIIFTTSGVGNIGKAYWGSYSVSKFGIEGFYQILADELESTEVRVNCLDPGATRTQMRKKAYPSENPNNVTKPEDILKPYLYLLSDESKSINGERIACQSH
ncbi:MAG: YciK family oxidoreductase [Gammaproteobacteria bacterium TMED78]|nr:MAG: YciK family oxidoreductase [Gammaproteobacteria bacterium TMED78]|tara:strand:+ start:25724 stop:26473 length:750 start_codon:yes stop_codon:yes gene_type:complete